MESTFTLQIVLGLLLIINFSLLVVLIGVSQHMGVRFKRIPFPWRKMQKNEIRDADTSTDEADLTTSEMERLQKKERDEKMQERLQRIKRELDAQQTNIRRKGYTAVEENPHVKNLPHDAVNAYQPPDGEEYAE